MPASVSIPSATNPWDRVSSGPNDFDLTSRLPCRYYGVSPIFTTSPSWIDVTIGTAIVGGTVSCDRCSSTARDLADQNLGQPFNSSHPDWSAYGNFAGSFQTDDTSRNVFEDNWGLWPAGGGYWTDVSPPKGAVREAQRLILLFNGGLKGFFPLVNEYACYHASSSYCNAGASLADTFVQRLINGELPLGITTYGSTEADPTLPTIISSARDFIVDQFVAAPTTIRVRGQTFGEYSDVNIGRQYLVSYSYAADWLLGRARAVFCYGIDNLDLAVMYQGMLIWQLGMTAVLAIAKTMVHEMVHATFKKDHSNPMGHSFCAEEVIAFRWTCHVASILGLTRWQSDSASIDLDSSFNGLMYTNSTCVSTSDLAELQPYPDPSGDYRTAVELYTQLYEPGIRQYDLDAKIAYTTLTMPGHVFAQGYM